MARIKYQRAHFGIQPGTVVEEHRPTVVAKLTTVEQVYDNDKKSMIDVPAIVVIVPDSTPTTEELELEQMKKDGVEPQRQDPPSPPAPPEEKAAKAPATKPVKPAAVATK